MRTLLVTPAYPWPATTGSRQRVAMLVEAAGQIGEVDVFAWVDDRRGKADLERPANRPPDRLWSATRPSVLGSWSRRAGWFLCDRRPLRVALRDNREARDTLVAFRRHRYDAAVLVGAETAAVFGDLVPEPTVLDLIDLEDFKVASRLDIEAGEGSRLAKFGASRIAPWMLQGRRDERAWRVLQMKLARRSSAVTVCSELDRRRLGAPWAHVLTNGYAPPIEPAGASHRRSSEHPVVTFVGSFTYPPNVDGARYLVCQVAPLLRELLPGVSVRLVGNPSPAVLALNSPPQVIVTGFVDRVEDELATSDVVAVPIRHGGGTRIKVLEAFAHRVPVVSTPLGAEGIDVVDGRHLLLADSAADFAAACAQLIRDQNERERLVSHARRLFEEQYLWSVVRDRASDLLRSVGAERG